MKKLKPNHDEGMWKGAPSDSFTKAQFLRRNETKAEKLLWEKLRNNQLEGLKFRRQHPVNIYIADFYCHKLKLIIEKWKKKNHLKIIPLLVLLLQLCL